MPAVGRRPVPAGARAFPFDSVLVPVLVHPNIVTTGATKRRKNQLVKPLILATKLNGWVA
jgi:hypothetical protein